MVQEESVKLEYKLKSGEILEYKTNIESNNDYNDGEKNVQQQSLVEMIMEQKAAMLELDGTAAIEVTIKSGSVKVNGKEEALPNVGQKISMLMRKNGEIIKTSVDIPFTQPSLPEQLVRIGDRWEGESIINLPQKPEPLIIKYYYTFSGFENFLGYHCAVIKIDSPETKIKLDENVFQTLKANGETLFAYKEGKLIKSEVTTIAHIQAPNIVLNTLSKLKIEILKSAPPLIGMSEEAFIAR
ncbi:MAG: hypothetical protein HYU63_06365 [Armatimonadetes bacterium]|nr:hypothetical protein [Armatimonadota bacterium]